MFRKFACCLLAIIALSTVFSIPHCYAEDGEVVKVLLPSPHGGYTVLQGSQAAAFYHRIVAERNRVLNDITSDLSMMSPGVLETFEALYDIQPTGMFTYKYRVLDKSSGTTSGAYTRCSPYVENPLSHSNSYAFSMSKTVDWSINVNLTGRLKSMFEANVGAGWKVSYSTYLTINHVLPPMTYGWVEFSPSLNYSKGTYQKYFRTLFKNRLIIQESHNVYSTSPRSVNGMLDGSYIIREAPIT